jgi:hypothetical protein
MFGIIQTLYLKVVRCRVVDKNSKPMVWSPIRIQATKTCGFEQRKTDVNLTRCNNVMTKTMENQTASAWPWRKADAHIIGAPQTEIMYPNVIVEVDSKS